MRIVTAVVAMILAATVFTTAHAVDQIPQQFTNLQVLPKDISQSDLIGNMRQFAITLGVRCEHCHDGEGNDLSQFNFASDVRPAKATARRMMQMVAAINGQFLEGIGAPADEPKVTCFTCHRGSPKPAAGSGGG